MSTKYHLCIDISGALRNWTAKNFARYYFGSVLHDDGRSMTHAEAIFMLKENRAMGRRVLPIGECDNFDYQNGCMGHPAEKEVP